MTSIIREIEDSKREISSILVVDDDSSIRKMMLRLFRKDGYKFFEAENGVEALKVMAQEKVDMVVTDLSMPELNGIELTYKIKQQYDVDVIMMTGYFRDLDFNKAIALGASDFIKKPFESEEFRIRIKRVLQQRKTESQLKKSLKKNEEMLDGMISALSATVEARDPYTSGHQKRVAAIAVSIARLLNFSEDRVKGLFMAGLIHDLGKIAIPAEILSKPGQLSDAEFILIKNHPQAAYDILKDINFSTPVAEIVYQHHERIDGSGYPRGLRGDEILLEAKILAVSDVVEAMSSHRPYRPALGIEVAIGEILKHKGIIYDSDVVRACIDSLENKDFAVSLDGFK